MTTQRDEVVLALENSPGKILSIQELSKITGFGEAYLPVLISSINSKDGKKYANIRINKSGRKGRTIYRLVDNATPDFESIQNHSSIEKRVLRQLDRDCKLLEVAIKSKISQSAKMALASQLLQRVTSLHVETSTRLQRINAALTV